MPETNSNKDKKAFDTLNKNPIVNFRIPLKLAVTMLTLARTSPSCKNNKRELDMMQAELAKQLEV